MKKENESFWSRVTEMKKKKELFEFRFVLFREDSILKSFFERGCLRFGIRRGFAAHRKKELCSKSMHTVATETYN